MMNFIRLTTWKNKLAPFLCLMYAFFCKKPDIALENQIITIFFLLAGIILIAIWASLINNYYDIEVDTIAGKPNGMAKISPFLRKLSLVFCIILGLTFCYLLLPNLLASFFYVLSWLCFYLYSSTTIRLKEKPFFDLLTDGLASQLFPSLYIFAYLFEGDFDNNYVFILSSSLWLFLAMGVRALIMHQYLDEEKDRQVSLNTYVLGNTAMVRNKAEFFLLSSEIAFFTIFAFSIHWIVFILPVFLYGILLWILKKKFANIKIVYFKLNGTVKHRIFLYDAYTLFIFCLLGLLCWQNLHSSIFIIFHLLVFHVAIIVRIGQILKKQ